MSDYLLDDCLPAGNAIALSASKDHLIFTPAAKGGAERLWFNARIRPRQAGLAGSASVRLTLAELDALLGGGGGHLPCPVWRVDGGDWQRLTDGVVSVTADGRKSVSWMVSAPVHVGELAVCMPYGGPELQELLQHGVDYWSCDRIGTSGGDRALLRLSNACPEPGDQRPGLFMMARTHSGETPGSWLLDGMLRYFATARVSDMLIWCVPFVDRDGVDEGRYGKDHWPRDVNRAWTNTQTYSHEVAQVQQDMRRWAQRCRPILMIDSHAPGLCDVNPHVHDDDDAPDPLTDSLAAAYGVSANNFRRAMSYGRRLFEELGMGGEAPCSTAWARSAFGIRALTFETPYDSIGDRLLLADDYRCIGAACAEAMVEWVREQAALVAGS